MHPQYQSIELTQAQFAFDDESPQLVQLPHTWNALDGQDGGDDYRRGKGEYRFTIDESILKSLHDSGITLNNYSNELWLECEGIALQAQVYINNTLVDTHQGGYSTWRTNLTQALQDEQTNNSHNQLVLRIIANNANDSAVLPQHADFTFYGGMYRPARLLVVPSTHFALLHNGDTGIEVAVHHIEFDTQTTRSNDLAQVQAKRAQITLAAHVEGVAANQCSVQFTIPQANGDDICEHAAVHHGIATTTITIANPQLWKGTLDPFLYQCHAKLINAGNTIDERAIAFGVRTMQVDPQQGFMLNGVPYPLRGVSRHQDWLNIGNALLPEHHKRDMEIITDMGANAIRLAHYQHAQYFYDLCDKQGIIVWAEIPLISMFTPDIVDNARLQLTELIEQNKHHASIFCWALSNEITAASPADDALLLSHQQLNELCHQLDTTRPTAIAHVFMLETNSPMLQIPDLNAYNLYYGWYLGELSDNDEFFDTFHQQYPNIAMGLTEYGADANPDIHADKPQRGDYSEEYQFVYHEHMLNMIEQRPWLWCSFVWNMFDFAADGRDEGGEHGKNQKGLVTLDRNTFKDSFYLYRAYWSAQPTLHLCSQRYINRVGPQTTITIVTNLQKVDLYIDDIYQETLTGARVYRRTVAIHADHTVTVRAGNHTDSLHIHTVNEPDSTYVLAPDHATQKVTNWFADIAIDPHNYSVHDTIGSLLGNAQTRAIIQPILETATASRGNIATTVMQNNPALQRMIARQTLISLLHHVGEDIISQDMIQHTNTQLQQIARTDD